jgi:hypothetical protein
MVCLPSITLTRLYLLLAACAGLALSSSAALEDSGPTDLRPSWATGQYAMPLNSSILYSNQNPSYATPVFGTNLIGKGKVDALRDDYENRNRDYNMRTTYGIATQSDEMDHEQSMKDIGHQVINAARNGQTQQYGQNVSHAEQHGDISQPLVYAGGAVGIGTGTPIKMKLGKDTQATWSSNVMNRQSTFDVHNPNVSATVKMDESSSATELYQVSVSKPLALGVNSGASYGGTSNTVSGSLSRAIVGSLSASVGGSMPAGANNPTGAVAQGTVGVNYGMKF